MGIDLFRFYGQCLVPLSPSPAVTRILKVTMSGGETTEDFSQIVAQDTELQHWVRLTVQRLGFDRRLARLDQMITLLGQNRIRDLVIARNIERAFVPESESLLSKAQKNKSSSEQKGGKAKATDDAKPSPEVTEDSEVIPALSDFQVYLTHANKAEEVAVAIRNSYPGQAFAGGVLFDYARVFLKQRPLEGITDPRLVKTDAFIEETFLDGLRCGVAANEIIQKISIPHQKNVFVTALLHNIGKILLLAYDPPVFEKSFLLSTAEGDVRKRIDSSEAEQLGFDFDHAQAGSLFMGRLPFLADIERSIDYHHTPGLLRFSNPGLYALACVLRISGALEHLYQKQRSKDLDIDRIPDQKLMASKDFQFLKLNDADWREIKANYALKLMKTGL